MKNYWAEDLQHTRKLKKKVPEPTINLERMGHGDIPNRYPCPVCGARSELFRNPQTHEIYVSCTRHGYVKIHKER